MGLIEQPRVVASGFDAVDNSCDLVEWSRIRSRIGEALTVCASGVSKRRQYTAHARESH